LELNALIRSFDYRSIADVWLHIQYTSQRDTSGGLAAAASENALTVLSEAAKTSMSRGLAIVVDPRAEHAAAWKTFHESGTLTIPGPALRSNLPFYARASAVDVRRVRLLGEYTGTADMQLTLVVGNTEVDFTLVKEAGTDDEDKGKGAVGGARSGLGARGGSYKIGADEKLADDLGVRWEAEGEGDGYKDWVFTAQNDQTAKRLRSLQVLVGYTVDL
jgi:hypothetical protein